MKNLRGHLTYANVVSTICLFFVLSGGAYAVAKVSLPKGSVGAKQIKAGAVGAKQIKAGAVNGAKVADGSLTGADVADGSLTGADVADGSLAGADVADGSLATADIADGAINSAKVLDKSLKGTDVAPDSLTGAEIDESTLGAVPNAANATRLGGKTAAGFVTSDIYQKASPEEEGHDLGDGTFAIEESCEPDVLLSGGPADVDPTSSVVESFPAPALSEAWKARIRPSGGTDKFVVVVLCARQ